MQSRGGGVRNISSIELEQAAHRLGISGEMLARVLTVKPDVASDRHEQAPRLGSECGESNQALLFMRMFDSLLALVNDDQLAREWILGANKGLDARPIDLMLKGRLDKVVRYLEQFRFRS